MGTDNNMARVVYKLKQLMNCHGTCDRAGSVPRAADRFRVVSLGEFAGEKEHLESAASSLVRLSV
jgi:hypothetical protein